MLKNNINGGKAYEKLKSPAYADDINRAITGTYLGTPTQVGHYSRPQIYGYMGGKTIFLKKEDKKLTYMRNMEKP